uniref:Uncharacterized protein n=1 Tax=Manihot esculenta TaxID=3983 RepID=A0A2C9WNF6_MANES
MDQEEENIYHLPLFIAGALLGIVAGLLWARERAIINPIVLHADAIKLVLLEMMVGTLLGFPELETL